MQKKSLSEKLSKLDKSSLPQGFTVGIENGSIREEIEGKFYDSLKAHFIGAA